MATTAKKTTKKVAKAQATESALFVLFCTPSGKYVSYPESRLQEQFEAHSARVRAGEIAYFRIKTVRKVPKKVEAGV